MKIWEAVFPFWHSLSDLQQAEILDCTIIRQYSEGERIKKRQGLYIVNEGGLLVYMLHDNGRKRILLTGSRFEVIVLPLEFLSASDSIALELRAKKDSEIYYIPEESWEIFQERNKEIRRYTSALLSKHLSTVSNNLYQGLENVGKQLAMFLLRSYEKEGKTVVEISHEELADLLGTTREVITRNISIFKNLGLVETGRNKILIINPEGMMDYTKQQSD